MSICLRFVQLPRHVPQSNGEAFNGPSWSGLSDVLYLRRVVNGFGKPCEDSLTYDIFLNLYFELKLNYNDCFVELQL